VKALLDRARQEVEEGVLPSCQVALAHRGELVAFETFGEATNDTRFVVFSCVKAMVAAAAWALSGEDRLSITAPVVEYVPEFDTLGKHAVRVEHLLLHTAGFPQAGLGPPEWETKQGRLDTFAQWQLDWEPGTAYEYHPTSAHWVLAEVIERVSGMDYRDYIHERVCAPAGIRRRVLGVPEDEQEGIAALEVGDEVATPEELEAALGVRELPVSDLTYEALLWLNRPDTRAVGVPGGGGIMRADELALFYQALLHDPEGIWDPDVLADGTGTIRNRFNDGLFGIPANRSRGLVVAGDDGLGFLRGFGYAASAAAFGHGGAGGQLGWADPATGLSLAFATNGIDANVIRQARRGIDISTAAALCVSSD
jgi:CubicO group peptidase (beta-lactamase class C family)